MKQFNPTPAQIEAAQDLVIAMAWHKTVKPVYEAIETAVLKHGQFHYSPSSMNRRDDSIPSDGIIKNRLHTCLMAGVMEYGTPEYNNSDADRYNLMVDFEMTAKGFNEGANVECKASYHVTLCENKLIEATKNIHSLNIEQITRMEHRKQLVDLLLKLFVPHANVGIKPRMDSFFNSKQL